MNSSARFISLVFSSFFFCFACTKAKETSTIVSGTPAWANPFFGEKPTNVNMSKESNYGPVEIIAGLGAILGGCGTSAATSTSAASYTCPSGEVAVGSNLCCPSSSPYLCGSPAKCYASACGTSGSSGSSSGGSSCTSQVCCGGLYECNGRCYSECTPGSQPCCSTTDCVCFTPCC